MRGVFPAQCDWNLDAFVDDSLEEARAERQAVAFNRNQIERSVVNLDRLAGLGERVLELEQVIGRDAADVTRRERRERKDVVDAGSGTQVRGAARPRAGSRRAPGPYPRVA
jgi:hypothetical protein